jgi:mixed-linked glucan synthase
MAAGQQQASGGAKHGCVCGFPVCACAGAAAVASAASSADMDRVAVAATEGQIGAVNDESWIAVDLSDDGLSADGADPGVALEDRPVFRTEKIKGVLLHPYRYTPPPPFLTYRSISALSFGSFTSPARARRTHLH